MCILLRQQQILTMYFHQDGQIVSWDAYHHYHSEIFGENLNKYCRNQIQSMTLPYKVKEVSRPGLCPKLCWSETQELEFGAPSRSRIFFSQTDEATNHKWACFTNFRVCFPPGKMRPLSMRPFILSGLICPGIKKTLAARPRHATYIENYNTGKDFCFEVLDTIGNY